MSTEDDFGVYLPTPEEIEAKTKEIQSRWSKAVERRRTVQGVEQWMPQQLNRVPTDSHRRNVRDI